MPIAPRLKPLSQWFCDRCRKIIDAPHDGIVRWRSDVDHPHRGFEIIHKQTSASKKCDDGNGSWLDIDDLLGEPGVRLLITLLHPGESFMPDANSLVESPAEWAELFRRLQLPYWEEARAFILSPNESVSDIIDGLSPSYITTPDVLLRVIAAGLDP